MRKNNLKYLLSIPLILIIGVSLFLMLQTNLPKSTNSVRSASINFIDTNTSTTSVSPCPMEGGINYYYYSRPSGSQPRNNKFGLYIYAEVDKYFEVARKLVNSNGGDWGYVLIPFNVRDENYDKWSKVFTNLTEKHLIPIVQLHDIDVDKYKEETDNSADFLNSFVWPIKQRYISVYNEPNDANFWGGKVDPEEYAQILNYTINAYKKVSKDFFMLNGALNSSAGNTRTTMDSEDYMFAMNEAVPGLFNKLDGWASHSYPQPNFSGNPADVGRWSIRAYQDELTFLKVTLGVNKELPVFITETGWAHAEGSTYDASYLPVKKVADNFKKAYENYWLKDDRVMAVIPFTIWYKEPFDHFAWVREDLVPYEHYDVIKNMKKIAGNPEKLETSKLNVVGCN